LVVVPHVRGEMALPSHGDFETILVWASAHHPG